MEPPIRTALTAWQQKERDGLLALETAQWREKRMVAEDPDTTADVLACLLQAVEVAVQREGFTGFAIFYPLIADAVAVHPNLSPEIILKYWWLTVSSAFCQNPIAPFLGLEVPDFWARLPARARFRLSAILAEETLPSSIAQMLTHHSDIWLAQEAGLHISLAGEITTRAEGLTALTNYWREFCRAPKLYNIFQVMSETGMAKETRRDVAEWHAELVRFGLAPAWAAPLEPFQKRHILRKSLSSPGFLLWHLLSRHTCSPQSHRSFVANCARRWVLAAVTDSRGEAGEFAEFAAMLHNTLVPGVLQYCSSNRDWWERLNAAFRLPLSNVPFSRDKWNRSPLDLLHHLSHDGNRFVRWAAQTRLADPDFVFTWDDG